jgi:hypothetical protein
LRKARSLAEKDKRNSPTVLGQFAQRTYFLGEQTGGGSN